MKTENKVNMGENEVKVFENSQFGKIRVEIIGGEPTFCLIDICNAIDISNSRNVKERIDSDDVRLVDVTDSLGRLQSTTFVTEGGMYDVVVRSDSPKAKPFRRWLTHEVVPSIRKTGEYSMQKKLPQTYSEALRELADKVEENEALKTENRKMLPKASYFDSLIDRGLNVCFRDAAKEIGVKQKEFIAYLLENKYVYRNKAGKLRPHADYDNDLFVVKDTKSDSNGWAGVQTLVTPKGKETFRLLLNV